MNPLEAYVYAWREAIGSIQAICVDLTDEQWATATDCPGWTVRDVVAHTAHLESELNRTAQATFEATGAAEVVSDYTEAGVAERRDRSPAELLTELAETVKDREVTLTALPDDPKSPAPITPGGVAWSWDTLLRNRAVDTWVHEQDIRRALGMPGSLDTAGAVVTTKTFAAALPYVVGKLVGPPTGTTVVLAVSGGVPFDRAFEIADNGRAERPALPPSDPTVALTMDAEVFTILGAGRRSPADVDVSIAGDATLGNAILGALAVTP